MYEYYRDNTGAMPIQNQYNPMTTMPEQNSYNPMMMPMQNPYNPMMTMPVQNSYNPMMMPMQNPYNPMMAMPIQNQYNPMPVMPAQGKPNPTGTMPEQELENLYPTTYNIIKPACKKACDKMMGKDGKMHTPTQSELESMVSDVYDNVQSDVEAAVTKGAKPEERQFFGGGRRLLRDFIAAVLITDLIGRRRPFYPGFYGYSYGYGYPYNFY